MIKVYLLSTKFTFIFEVQIWDLNLKLKGEKKRESKNIKKRNKCGRTAIGPKSLRAAQLTISLGRPSHSLPRSPTATLACGAPGAATFPFRSVDQALSISYPRASVAHLRNDRVSMADFCAGGTDSAVVKHFSLRCLGPSRPVPLPNGIAHPP